MKRSYLAIFGLVFSGVGFAAVPDDGPRYSASYSENYLRLARMFDEGTNFNFDEAIGWYSGRCWRAHSETPLNGLLVIDQRETDGPEFPPVKKFSFYHEWAGQPENFFDTYDDDRHDVHAQARMTRPEAMVHSWRKVIAERFLNDWDDTSKIAEADGGGFTAAYSHLSPMVVRRTADDKYFVLKRGDTIICYFFQPITKVNLSAK